MKDTEISVASILVPNFTTKLNLLENTHIIIIEFIDKTGTMAGHLYLDVVNMVRSKSLTS